MLMPAPLPPVRFVGLDVHRQSITVAAVDKEQQVVLRPRRFALAEFLDWAKRHLTPTDAVVLEATTNAWQFYDHLQPLVASVTVAHPVFVKLIAAARVKTDPRDTLHLARLLAAGLIPPVWVPPREVREVRSLVAHRQRLIQQRTRIRNHLQAILHTYNVQPPAGEPFAQRQAPWWQELPLPAVDRLRVRQGWAQLASLEPLLGEVETELLRLSMNERWVAQVPYLVQLPGIGAINAMILLSAIGDITRFPTAKQLVGYSGLGASIRASGDTQRQGGMTKQGRREIRTTLVEAAWVAVARHPHWKTLFQRLCTRMNKRKAIVAVARKLLVVIWHVLAEQVADRQAEVEAVARKLLLWGSAKGMARQLYGTRGVFVRQQLTRLGLGAELTKAGYGKEAIKLPAIGTS
jgi:transposase